MTKKIAVIILGLGLVCTSPALAQSMPKGQTMPSNQTPPDNQSTPSSQTMPGMQATPSNQTTPNNPMMPNDQMTPNRQMRGGPMAMPTAQETTSPADPAAAPSTAAFMAASAKMHQDMAITYSGKPSLDFVTAMIPHHQSAIEMARIALRYGTDNQTRRLAQKIITTQEAEIAQMTAIARRLKR